MTDKNNQIADISEDIQQTLLKEFAENTSCLNYELPGEQKVGYFIDEEAEYDPSSTKPEDKTPV